MPRRRLAAFAAVGVAAVYGQPASAFALPTQGGAINDVSATRTAQLISVGLALSGLILALVTIWWWRSTKPHHDSLGPLQVMSERRWWSKPDNARQRALELARPGALPEGHDDPKPVDLAQLAAARDLPAFGDGGGFGDLADLAVPSHASSDAADPAAAIARADLFNQADHTDWTGRPVPTLAESLAAQGAATAAASAATGADLGSSSSLADDLTAQAAGRANEALAQLVRSSSPVLPTAPVPPPPPSGDAPPPVGDRSLPSVPLAAPTAESIPVVDPAAQVVPPPERLSDLPFRPFRRTYGEPGALDLPPPRPEDLVESDLDPDLT